MERTPFRPRCFFSGWPPINLFQLIVAVVMLLLGVWGDRLGLSAETKQLVLGVAIALLIALSAGMLPGPTEGGPQGAPPFTRLKLVNLTDVPLGARTKLKNSEGHEVSVPPEPGPPLQVPPGQAKELRSADDPYMEEVVSVTTTIYRGPSPVVTTFEQAPPPGMFIAAQDLYGYRDPVTHKYRVHSVLFCKIDTLDPEYVQVEADFDI
jgi:hypothetical protein